VTYLGTTTALKEARKRGNIMNILQSRTQLFSKLRDVREFENIFCDSKNVSIKQNA
jgi:hypothetical protein